MMGNEWIMRACAQAEREGGRSMKHEAQKIGKNRAANRAVPSACPSRSGCRKPRSCSGAEKQQINNTKTGGAERIFLFAPKDCSLLFYVTVPRDML